MKTPNYSGFLFFFFFFISTSTLVHASVRITELMYDTVGVKAGREWVEIVNDTGSSVDIKNWKLFQGSSNHGLALIQGATIVPAQGVVVIAADANKFKTDWPTYSGTLFRSAFTLSSRGTTVILKNATLSAVDTASFTPDMGAKGDGNSLHRSGEAFVGGAPDPGVFSGIPAPVNQAKTATTKTVSIAQKTATKQTTPPANVTANTAEKNTTKNTAVAAAQGSSVSTPLWGSLIGLAALIILGIAAVWYARPTPTTSSAEEEFDIE